jgi:hypothetical protein
MGITEENVEKSTFQFLSPAVQDSDDCPQTLCRADSSASSVCPENSISEQSCASGPAVNGSSQKTDGSDAGGSLYTSDDSGFVDCPLTPATTASKLETVVHSANADSEQLCGTETEKSQQRTTLRQLLRLNLGGPRKKQSSTSLASTTTVKRTASTPVFTTPVESPSEISANDDDLPTSPWSHNGAFSTPTYAKMRHFAQSPIQQPFARVATAVARNPYMSPLLASDDLLVDMCPVYLVVSILNVF